MADIRKLQVHDGQLGGVNGGEVDGDALLAEAIDETHTFNHMEVLAIDATSYVLANNTNVAQWAAALCYIGPNATATQYGAIYLPQIIPWGSAHSLGARASVLWLTTAGGMSATKPTGSSVVVEQKLGWVLNETHIMWKPENPRLLG